MGKFVNLNKRGGGQNKSIQCDFYKKRKINENVIRNRDYDLLIVVNG
jgi:hypothetical protein